MATAKRPLPEADDEGHFLGVRAAAVFLRCSPSKIQRMRTTGALPKGPDGQPKRKWTREELLLAAKNEADQPPKPRGRGLKLDLGQPVKKKDGVSSSGGAVATAPTKTPGAPSAPKSAESSGGFLSSLMREVDELLDA